MRKKLCLSVVCLLMLLCFAVPGLAADYRMVVAGGPQGGAWYGLAGALAKEAEIAIPGLRASVIPGGGVGNIALVEKGEAQLATTVSHLYRSALGALPPYPKMQAQHLAGLAHIGTSDTCLFLVRKDFPANSIEEIKEKKLAIKLMTTGKASTPALGTERILAAYGISLDDISKWGGNISYMNYADATQHIADGHADGIIAPVVPAIVELSKTRELKMLPLDKKVLDELVETYGYATSVMTKGSYSWITEDVTVLGEPNILLLRSDVPEEIVYSMTKLICTKPDIIRSWGNHHVKFTPQEAPQHIGGPLHPGAARYYKEMGYIE